MSIPHRHDLIRNSRVNNAVEAYNMRLCKRMKRFENVEMINLGTERDFYTKNEHHLNTTERMSMKIASTIQSTKEKMELISVKWKNDKVSDTQEHLAS
jgi:hypothetical protein